MPYYKKNHPVTVKVIKEFSANCYPTERSIIHLQVGSEITLIGKFSDCYIAEYRGIEIYPDFHLIDQNTEAL